LKLDGIGAFFRADLGIHSAVMNGGPIEADATLAPPQ